LRQTVMNLQDVQDQIVLLSFNMKIKESSFAQFVKNSIV